MLRLNGDGLTPHGVTIDGEATDAYEMRGGDLLLTLPGDAHEVSIATEIDPTANTQLMGLFASGGMLCTQCEAEGFRRITFFPDRPDVLSVYTVRMTGSKAAFPVLLSNGNKVAEGSGDDGDPLGGVARSVAQAVLSVRAGRGRSGGQYGQLHHHVRAQGATAPSMSATAICRAPTMRCNR